jgi:hypothetical protein
MRQKASTKAASIERKDIIFVVLVLVLSSAVKEKRD